MAVLSNITVDLTPLRVLELLELEEISNLPSVKLSAGDLYPPPNACCTCLHTEKERERERERERGGGGDTL